MKTSTKKRGGTAPAADDEIAPRQFKHETLTIRITEEGMDFLREVAQRKQVAPSTLARMWIFEKLSQEPPPKAGPWV